MSKLWTRAGIACVVIGVVLFLVLRRRAYPLQVGATMPQVTLQEAGTGDFTLRRESGHVVLVNFWASWCPPCVLEAPSLERFAKQMQPLGVRVVGVSIDQSLPQLQKFMAAYHLTYPILRDPDQRLMRRFGTYKTPETYIFDRDGRLADKIISDTDWEDPRMIRFVEDLAHWPARSTGEATSSAGNY
jgi:cytochrome c biogenesis protein CcmG, thiol:disulfide interchange protein DsbE